MKIIFFSSYPPSKDGIGDYTARFVDSMKAQGEEVYVIAPKGISDKEDSEQGIYRILSNTSEDIQRVLEVINEIQPDIIHVQYCIAQYGLGFWAILRIMAKVKRQLPATARIVTLHEVQREQQKIKVVAYIFYRYFLRFFDGYITHLLSSEKMLIRRYALSANKVAAIPLPVVQSRQAVSKADVDSLNTTYSLTDKFVVLCFGFIQIDKGIEYLVRSVPNLNKNNRLMSEAKIIIAGDIRPRSILFKWFERKDRKYLKRIHSYIQENHLEDQVIFTGYVKSNDVASWFARADVISIPYTSIEQSAVFGTALSAGKPIIASSVGGLGETLKDTGILVSPRNSSQIAEAITSLYLHRDAHQKLTEGYKQLTKINSQSVVSVKTINFYKRILKNL